MRSHNVEQIIVDDSGDLCDEEECLKIKKKIIRWSEVSGLVGNDDFYERERISRLVVCKGKTLPECMAYLWNDVSEIIRECTYRHSGEWKISSVRRNGDVRRGTLVLIAFPFCEELKDYKQFAMFHAALDFSQSCTRYFGRTFRSTHFHPVFKKSDPMPRYRSRRSPVPTIGFSIGGLFDNYDETKFLRHFGRRHSKGQQAFDESHQMHEMRATLTLLYNRAAASGTADYIQASRTKRNNFSKYSKNEMILMTEQWMKQNNKRLSFDERINLPLVDEWFICRSFKSEEVFEQVWQIISAVYNLGTKKKDEMKTRNNIDPIDSMPPYATWLEILGQFSKRKNQKFNTKISYIILFSSFCAFDAKKFEKFCVCIEKSLHFITHDKIRLKSFHPENVGKKGKINLYRSPYPTVVLDYL
eukprot:CAMPEP_0116060466 /NCGR_PEP_ID=MMETSP0322-20121206/6438_1 /TAXON_ID=163516 /ORGANISM="Leptocylindrus danicus var. apora, Strain B651" /LENGTH=414 /DNA_ID=CAMNT_0003545103 /DNA_START=376 /DNA_END=1616 /DNA_ORIENTATION=-